MRSERSGMVGGLLVALLALAGCSGKNSQVSGTITVDGTPIAEGTITFVPVDGKTATAGGKITDGQYSVKVPMGTMKVSISQPKVIGKKKLYPTPNSPEQDVTAESLPERYNEKTELTLEVTPGKTEKDWELHRR